ncbi:hypothetical protein HYC85_025516 [Camellia sinensis]|uniref:Uncharacterized protein n=1 Tax=Camellia sinensis TaxID=4442 RepID=A0A7J7GB90_CAMSI|nr:hypothetical protein HYC85_025516 [Camellia sinensis]
MSPTIYIKLSNNTHIDFMLCCSNFYPMGNRPSLTRDDVILVLRAGLTNLKRREEMERLDKERQAEVRSYKNLMVAEKMTSNKEIASANKSLQELEEDFM